MSLPRPIVLIVVALVAVSFFLLGTGSASASSRQAVYFEAPRDLLNASTRDHALSELDSLGVHALRVTLYWRSVAPAPDSSARPAFVATDPRAYAWGQYDAVLAAATQRHWPVLLTVSGPVPRWATAARRDNVTRPSAQEYGMFMTAVARHYRTEVQTYSVWNEPNHPQFLDPQYVHGRPASPRIYRALFQAGYSGLKAGGIAHPNVLMGETAPRGTGHDVAPLTFLRGALCLDASYHKSSSCSALPATGYAHHAYTTTAGPFFVPPGPNDVTIGVLSRLTRALDRAARARALAPHLGLYLTEFGIQSKPNPFLGVSLSLQAQFQEISEHIAYQNPRVRAFSQYLLRDDAQVSRPSSGSHSGFIGFQSGLELANGRPKPALAGFRLPLVVHHHGAGVSLWGLVRPARAATSVQILIQDGRSSHLRLLTTASTNAAGYWHARGGYRRGRHWRVRWRSPTGTVFTGPPIGPE